jgi:hypothetical protein
VRFKEEIMSALFRESSPSGKDAGPAAFSFVQIGQHLVNTMQKITHIFLHFPALTQNSG